MKIKTIGTLIFIIGAFLAGLATISSIGYALYLWGALGGALGASMWTAFLLWLKMVVGGLCMVIVGVVMGGGR